jgi:hypothetical protein
VFSVLLALAAPAQAIETPFEAARRGARCGLETDGTLSCRYRVGADLEFDLAHVAQDDVRLRLARSDPDGDYATEREMIDGCVQLRYGALGLARGGSRFDHAFVSSRNGFVYRSLRECRASR